MENIVRRTSNSMILLGIASILFGVCLIAAPGFTIVFWSVFLGWLLAGLGIASIVVAFQNKQTPMFKSDLFVGIIFAIMGGLIIAFPIASDIYLFFVLAFWVLFVGVQDLIEAIYAKKEGHEATGWMFANAIITILMGILMVCAPASSAVALVIVAAASLCVSGTMEIITAIKIEKAA